MSNAQSSRFSGTLLGAIAVSLMGAASFGAELVSRPFSDLPYSPRDRSTPYLRAFKSTLEAQRKGKRKPYRTVRAETHQGRILRHHFDANRLTRSQMKKFYAGKAVY